MLHPRPNRGGAKVAYRGGDTGGVWRGLTGGAMGVRPGAQG